MTATAVLELTVADVLLRIPGAAQVFTTRGMSCVGCAFAPFETVSDVARIYGFDAGELATALSRAGSPETTIPKE